LGSTKWTLTRIANAFESKDEPNSIDLDKRTLLFYATKSGSELIVTSLFRMLNVQPNYNSSEGMPLLARPVKGVLE
jgi:hypothetical protein